MKMHRNGGPVKARSRFDAPPDDGGEVGEAGKRAALALLELRRPRVVLAGRRALLLHLLEHGTGTMDDVRRLVQLPPGVDARVFGAVGSQLVTCGIIRFGGYSKTTRPEAHRHPVSVWVLADREKAVAWLAANPELPEQANGGAA